MSTKTTAQLQIDTNVQKRRMLATPIITELNQAGFDFQSLDGLRRSRSRYLGAIPILLKWLPLVQDLNLKESIVRALSVPWAKNLAAKPLLAELRRTSNANLRWALGNAIAVSADDTIFNDLAEIVQDRTYGKSREMLTVALSKMKDPSAVDLLLVLLLDEEVAGHAIIALGRLKAHRARLQIEAFRNHPKTWIRNEAKKALANMSKV